MAFATSDGRVWRLDDDIHPLYAHAAVPYRLAVSPDGARVASGFAWRIDVEMRNFPETVP